MIDRRWFAALALLLPAPGPSPAAALKFERIVVDADFPDGYQVEVADVNGDGKPDLVGVGGGTCAWYENPSWKKRVVSTPKETPDIISSATADLDGDGKAEIAIAYDFAMNEPKRGKLTLAIQGREPGQPWRFDPAIRGISEYGSIHRLRWGRFYEQDGRTDLVIAPLFSPKSRPPAYEGEGNLMILPGVQPHSERLVQNAYDFFQARTILHAIDVVDVDGDGRSEILTADGLGVSLLRPGRDEHFQHWPIEPLVPGAPGAAPKRGCSEVHLGRFKDGRRFLATVEPWHGTDVAIYASESLKPLKFGPRTLIDDTLDDGHALWIADVDGDGDDEVFAGHRGKDARVSVYRYESGKWDRTAIDREITAQDLRGGDLDGDGVPDVVAIGGQSHNVVWYRPIRDKPAAK